MSHSDETFNDFPINLGSQARSVATIQRPAWHVLASWSSFTGLLALCPLAPLKLLETLTSNLLTTPKPLPSDIFTIALLTHFPAPLGFSRQHHLPLPPSLTPPDNPPNTPPRHSLCTRHFTIQVLGTLVLVHMAMVLFDEGMSSNTITFLRQESYFFLNAFVSLALTTRDLKMAAGIN